MNKLYVWIDSKLDPKPLDIDVTTFELIKRRERRKQSAYIAMANALIFSVFTSIFMYASMKNTGYLSLVIFMGVMTTVQVMCSLMLSLQVNNTDDLIYIKRMLEEKTK